MIVRLLSLPSGRRYFSKILTPLLHASRNDAVEAVYRIVTRSNSAQNLKESLKSSGFFLSNDLVDEVLKRFKIGHGNPSQALEFFKFAAARKGFSHSASALDTLLYVLGRNREFDHIWDVLIETKCKDPSLITPKTVQVVLGRVAKVCSVEVTVECFRSLKEFIPVFDTFCFNALLSALCTEKSFEDAMNAYSSMRNEFMPNVQTFNVLLSGGKSSEYVESLFEEMKELGVTPNVVSYNCLIGLYCKRREMDKARNVVDRMRKEGVFPDVITYTNIIVGLGLAGEPDKSRDVLKEMEANGCSPDVAAYNAAIKSYCVANRLHDAYSLMDEMVKKGMSPNATTYNMFFRVFHYSSDWQASWSLYRRMLDAGCFPNTQSCMFLVRLCKKHEKVEMALKLWNDMIEKGFGSYIPVSDVLFDWLCDIDKVAEVEKCFLQMVEKGYKPSYESFRRIKVISHSQLIVAQNRFLNDDISRQQLTVLNPMILLTDAFAPGLEGYSLRNNVLQRKL
ncbi:hypothetical protein Tsubulata_037397 [Turnera subulata]|uniref:Pentacotripeptide-repeat region of PRORP domain-containing protein n=1 Tax=Turnera subulata TaxID=218843 RepID=A0A9Q0JIR4_9ROSI|nr:hypothetical protein Tsubulata_037397 [Turnera subulata]